MEFEVDSDVQALGNRCEGVGGDEDDEAVGVQGFAVHVKSVTVSRCM